MRFLFITISLLVAVFTVKANSVERYWKSKDGLTVITSFSGKEDSLMLNAFFERLLNKLRRDDQSGPILLLIDCSGIKTSRKGHGFAAIAFDTLRVIDVSFIDAYYYNRMGKAFDENHHHFEPYPSNKYMADLPEPLDINASFNATPGTVGLKIIYEYGAADSVIGFDKIYTLVQYGIDNLVKIKNEQNRIAMDYEFGSAKVSFLTIDTSEINQLPLLSLGFDPKTINNQSFLSSKYWSIGVILILISLILFYYRSRQRIPGALKKSG